MIQDAQSLIRQFKEIFDTLPGVVSRAPGRINLLGQHIDHQGGYVNPVAIDNNIMLALRRRDDRLVHCRNVSSDFGDVTFDLGEFMEEAKRRKWEEYVAQRVVEKLPGGTQHWGRYILAGVLFLHRRLRGAEALKGYDILVDGDIPIASGLSSSSALVVATCLAIVTRHGWHIPRIKLVSLTGTAEFFVGTLSGFGDQAAILLSRNDHVSHFMFFPLRLIRYVEFPHDYSIVMCHSGQRAEKSAAARLVFNQRVASYHLARLWLKRFLTEKDAKEIKCLRDFMPRNQGAELARLYRLLINLPEKITIPELRNSLVDEAENVESLLRMCEGYESPFDLRGVCLYGLSEIARARRFIQTLADRRMDEVATIMNTSHNGDRLIRFNPETSASEEFELDYADYVLADLARKAYSRKRGEKAEAQLWCQPGRYRCSTPRLDEIVDCIRYVAPEAGAHLAGGGLGGSIIVICRTHDVAKISDTLHRLFYQRHSIEPMIDEVRPSGAAEASLLFHE